MSHHAAARLAWALCALALVLTALSLLLFVLNRLHPNTHVYAPWLDNTLVAISFAPIGALVASRRPANPVGWLLALFGLVISVSHFGAQYALYALLTRPEPLLGGQAAAWVVSWLLSVINGLTVFYVLLFPTGRLPSRRWRLLAWLTAAFVVIGVVSSAVSPGALMGVLGPIRNPLGVEGVTGIYEATLFVGAPSLTVAAALSLFVRLRRATGVERQQIKWFAYAAAASVGATILAYVLPGTLNTPPWFEHAAFALNIGTIPAVPVAVGIAILRYRLYDIDLLINRTLVYGPLTLFLAAVYAGGVVGLQSVMRTLTGQESTLAIVASTLAIAALFNPLRRRVQALVDRRFYRRKYDAAKTLEAFSARLREETDLDALGQGLVGVVRGTVQPEHASLWMRPEASRKEERAD
ncbi:MAG: hypothetical protein M3533_15275 [Actinomycetota bacterium]|jgi:hypothetical protein|nr:hypothetical protein [Actinomycetota bacterium]